MDKVFRYNCRGQACECAYDVLAELVDIGVESATGDWLESIGIPSLGDEDQEVMGASIGEELAGGTSVEYKCNDGTSGKLSVSAIVDAVKECVSEWDDMRLCDLAEMNEMEASGVLYYAVYQEMMW